MRESWESELVSKCLNGQISDPHPKLFQCEHQCAQQGSHNVKVRCASSVRCQQGPMHVMGASARGVPDLGSWQIWDAKRVGARGRFLAGLGASEGCGHE